METRICYRCGVDKPLEYFSRHKNYVGGRMTTCKSCIAIRSKKYKRSAPGLIKNMYNNQKQSSKRRGHPNPSYTKEELRDWIMSQPLFEELHKKWVDSGYERELVPSVDRLDDSLPYTMNNIRLTYWRVNKHKYVNEVLRSGNHPSQTPINQYSLDGKFITTFPSIAEAGRITGISIGNISGVCVHPNKYTAKGFIFRHTSEVEGQEDIPAVKSGRGKNKIS